MVCRIRFKKDGRLKFLSHLELLKAWDRAMRREGIPLIFSEGYSPRPLMTFALPSAVGICDLAGYMEVQVEEGFNPSRFLSMSRLPEGLEVLGAKKVEETSVSLMSRVYSVDYVIEGDLKALRKLESQEPLSFVRITKRGRRYDRDARDYILESQFSDAQLYVRLLAGSEQSIRISEFLESLTQDAAAHFDYSVTRVEIYDKEGKTLWEL